MTDFLKDATSFKGLRKKKKPLPSYGRDWPCQKCKTFGGWNLTINAYPLQPPENRNFNASCGQCSGRGWISAEDRDHIHDWKELSYEEAKEVGIKLLGSCQHPYQCSICKKTVVHDSSD